MLARNASMVVPVADALNGDVLLHISPKGNHCGFFVKVAPTLRLGPYIVSHEGNTDDAGGRTGGRLMQKTRPTSYWTHALRVA